VATVAKPLFDQRLIPLGFARSFACWARSGDRESGVLSVMAIFQQVTTEHPAAGRVGLDVSCGGDGWLTHWGSTVFADGELAEGFFQFSFLAGVGGVLF